MYWSVPISVSAFILIWALWPNRTSGYGNLGYEEISGALRLAAGVAFIVVLWTATISVSYLSSGATVE